MPLLIMWTTRKNDGSISNSSALIESGLRIQGIETGRGERDYQHAAREADLLKSVETVCVSELA
jgi:hypothetical protein